MEPRALTDKASALKASFICPISHCIMKDPVIAADGFTYDRESIEAWVSEKEAAEQAVTSPMTSEILEHTMLVPNRNLKSTIQSILVTDATLKDQYQEESKPEEPAAHSATATVASDPLPSNSIIKKPTAAPAVAAPTQDNGANLERLRRETLARDRAQNVRRFSEQPWWQEQEALWNAANNNIEDTRQDNIEAALLEDLGRIEGNVSAALVRIKLARNRGAEIPVALRTRAVESGNSELLKLLVFRQPDNLTLEDYKIAIKGTGDTEFLRWMIEVMNLTTVSDLNRLQSMTARFSRSASFMGTVLQVAGQASSRETVIAAIDNGTYDVFLTVWRAFSAEVENQQETWSEFTRTTINQGKLAQLSQILTDWPRGLPKLEHMYDAAFELLQLEVFQQLLANGFPFPENGYNRLLVKFNSTHTPLRDQLARAQQNRQRENFDDDSSANPAEDGCKIGTALVCLLGFGAMMVTGAFYLTGGVNVAIKRHSDDEVDDDTRQENENFDVGMATLVIGSVISIVFICCFVQYFCRVAPPLFEEFQLKHDIANLLDTINKIIETLGDHDVRPNYSDLEFARNAINNCPEEVLSHLVEAVQQSQERRPEADNCFARLFGGNRQTEQTPIITQESFASPA